MRLMDFVMKKYIFSLLTLLQITYFNTLSCCPCGFSPEDQRPFFEQYDIENTSENTSDTSQTEEK